MELTGKKQIRVLLADDHPVVMQGFAACLEESGFDVVGQAKTPEEAVTQYQQLLPDVIVLDIQFGRKETGIDAAKILLVQFPAIKIVFLSQYDQDTLIQETYTLGAKAFLTKDCDSIDLVNAVNTVFQGERYFLPKIAMRLANLSFGGTKSPVSILDERGIEVLKQMAKGLTIPEIAENLELSPKTISKISQMIKETFDIHRPADITFFALKHGLIQL